MFIFKMAHLVRKKSQIWLFKEPNVVFGLQSLSLSMPAVNFVRHDFRESTKLILNIFLILYYFTSNKCITLLKQIIQT